MVKERKWAAREERLMGDLMLTGLLSTSWNKPSIHQIHLSSLFRELADRS